MSKQIKSPPILLIDRDLIVVFALKIALIFLLVEEEVFFAGIVGPNIFDAFVNFAFVFHFLEVLDDFEGGSRTHGIINQFVFGGRPRGVFEFRC